MRQLGWTCVSDFTSSYILLINDLSRYDKSSLVLCIFVCVRVRERQCVCDVRCVSGAQKDCVLATVETDNPKMSL